MLITMSKCPWIVLLGSIQQSWNAGLFCEQGKNSVRIHMDAQQISSWQQMGLWTDLVDKSKSHWWCKLCFLSIHSHLLFHCSFWNNYLDVNGPEITKAYSWFTSTCLGSMFQALRPVTQNNGSFFFFKRLLEPNSHWFPARGWATEHWNLLDPLWDKTGSMKKCLMLVYAFTKHILLFQMY